MLERDGIDTIVKMAHSMDLDARALLRAAEQMEHPQIMTVVEAVDVVVGTLHGGTRDRYGRSLAKLTTRCGPWDIADVQPIHLKTWMQEVLAEAQDVPRTKHGHGAVESFITAARCLFKVAAEEGWRRDDPTTGIKTPPRPRSGRRALTESQLQDLFDVARFSGDDPDLDTLILWFALETGCRKQGLLELTASNINPDVPSVRVTEKYGHTRELPISTPLCESLLTHRDLRGPVDPVVFHYRDGTCLTGRRLDSFFRRVRERCDWAAEVGVSLHWLRHTTLTMMDRLVGRSITREFAGHSGGTVTDGYTKPEFDDLQYGHWKVFGSRSTESRQAETGSSARPRYSQRP